MCSCANILVQIFRALQMCKYLQIFALQHWSCANMKKHPPMMLWIEMWCTAMYSKIAALFANTKYALGRNTAGAPLGKLQIEICATIKHLRFVTICLAVFLGYFIYLCLNWDRLCVVDLTGRDSICLILICWRTGASLNEWYITVCTSLTSNINVEIDQLLLMTHFNRLKKVLTMIDLFHKSAICKTCSRKYCHWS